MDREDKALKMAEYDYLMGMIPEDEYRCIVDQLNVSKKQKHCPHKHTERTGGSHFGGGDYWDNISEVCLDCNMRLS